MKKKQNQTNNCTWLLLTGDEGHVSGSVSTTFIHIESSGAESHADLHLDILTGPETQAIRRPGDLGVIASGRTLKGHVEHVGRAATVVPYAARYDPVSPDSREAAPGIHQVRVVLGVAGEGHGLEVQVAPRFGDGLVSVAGACQREHEGFGCSVDDSFSSFGN